MKQIEFKMNRGRCIKDVELCECITKCPHDEGIIVEGKFHPTMVASFRCTECSYFQNIDYDNKIVNCGKEPIKNNYGKSKENKEV